MLFYEAVKRKIILPPLAEAFRVPSHNPRSAYEPANRWDFEIDALSEHEEGYVDIFEIKLEGDAKALGQLLFYECLLEKVKLFPNRMVRKHLICTKIQPELMDAFKKYGIEVHIFGEEVIKKVGEQKPEGLYSSDASRK
jgi:hypothetical protein